MAIVHDRCIYSKSISSCTVNHSKSIYIYILSTYHDSSIINPPWSHETVINSGLLRNCAWPRRGVSSYVIAERRSEKTMVYQAPTREEEHTEKDLKCPKVTLKANFARKKQWKRYPRRHSRIRAMMGDATHSSSAFAATAAVELDQSADIFRRRFPYAKCRMDLPMLWVLLRWDLQNGHLKNRYIWSALENYVYIRDIPWLCIYHIHMIYDISVIYPW